MLKVNPIAVKVKDLTVLSNDKFLLNNINLDLVPGQIIAILGASGSGKTTLLNVLAGRFANKNQISGTIQFNQQDPFQYYADGSCAFVQQFDYLMPNLTVRETLQYAAEFGLGSSITKDERNGIIESTILELGLKECANSRIGDSWNKGISGGEKRRVSVGCQLLTNPSLIFLDEPTTGLDAFSAYNLMEILKSLSRKGRTIFITIHQPRSDIFLLFDSIILLSKGECVYAAAGATKLTNYLESYNHICPTQKNPGDFVIDLISIDDGDKAVELESKTRVNRLVNCWNEVVASGRIIDYMYSAATPVSLPPTVPTNSNLLEETEKSTFILKSSDRNSSKIKAVKSNSILYQTSIITRRAWKNSLRDSLSLWGLLFEAIVVGVIFSIIFFRMPETVSGILTRKAAIFIVASSQPSLLVSFFVFKFVNDFRVFDREHADNLYGVVPHIIGQFIAQLPFNILFPVIFSTITYLMMGFRSDDFWEHFIRYSIGNVLMHLSILAFSQCSVSFFRDFSTAATVANAINIICTYSAGYGVQLDSIPIYLRWLPKVAPHTFIYRLLCSNEFSDKVYECSDIGRNCNGNDTLELLSIDQKDFFWPIIGLLCNFITFMLFALIVLHFIKIKFNKHAKSRPVKAHSSENEEKSNYNSLTRRKPMKVHIELKSLNLELCQRSRKWFKTTISKKTLLNQIDTEFQPGTLSIIMGESGSGKTTLLSIISGRMFGNTSSSMIQSGNCFFNGKIENDPSRLASICSFVRQSDDHLLPALTCRETLVYAAKLRLPSHYSLERKLNRVDEIITLLGLKDCANTIVGNEKVKGLSGGEKRRLSIGIQILADSSVLIIDEPTSGLDSFTAAQVMTILKNIATIGKKTIICSVHQPRQDIFETFDNLLLLARGGQVVYSGRADGIIPYLETCGLILPKFCNPADFILDVSSINFKDSEVERVSKERVCKLVEQWKSSAKLLEFKKMDGGTDHQSLVSTINGEDNDEATETTVIEVEHQEIQIRNLLPFLTVLPILLHRSFVNNKRQPALLISRVVQIAMLGIIQTLYYARLGSDQPSVQNRIGALQKSVGGLFSGLLNSVAVFPNDKRLFMYEFSDRLYSVTPFFITYMMIEIPIEVISSFIFSIFGLILIGFQLNLTSFLCMTLTSFCLVNLGESIMMILSTVFDHLEFTVNIATSALGIANIMSGMLSADMPVFLDRINRVSPVPYFTRLVTVNEFDNGIQFTCTTTEQLTGQCVYPNGTEVLRLLATDENLFTFRVDDFWVYLYVGVGLTVLYRLVAYAVLVSKLR